MDEEIRAALKLTAGDLRAMKAAGRPVEIARTGPVSLVMEGWQSQADRTRLESESS